jgi:hypothetical protein
VIDSWESKDPNEVKEYMFNWTGQLGTAVIATSLATVISGSVAITTQSFDTKFSKMTFAGGADNESCSIQIRITTDGGETLEAIEPLLVVDNAAPAVVTAYTLPTVSTLLSNFPEFAGVPSILFWIGRGGRNVDDSWTEKDYAFAVQLYACHSMALMGLGSGPDSKANSGQAALYSEIRSGQLTLKRKTTAETAGADGSLLGSTIYGRMYLSLLKQNRPRVAVAASPVSDVGVYGNGYGYQWTV